MKYLVVASFNLKGSESQDYEKIKDAFEGKGLKTTVTGASNISIELPATTYVGILEGESPKQVRMDIHAAIDEVFKTERLKGKYLVAVGQNASVGVKRF